jgi:hypothetical protein
MRSGSSTSTLGTDPNRISLLHRFGDLDLRRYGQNLSAGRSDPVAEAEPDVGGPGSARSIDSPQQTAASRIVSLPEVLEGVDK